MSKGLGALVFVVGVAGLGWWGASSQAVTMQEKIADNAVAAVAGSVHPLSIEVAGRDITLSGTADTEAELASLVSGLDAVPGRRVVNAEGVTVLPVVAPYETALAKGADGSFAATGYAPTAAARDMLAVDQPAFSGLPLAHGAPESWAQALAAGAAALAPLEEGSVALTGSTLSLAGIAATPFENETARAALSGLDSFDTIVALDVLDPGIVEFQLGYTADRGAEVSGTVPETLGPDRMAALLGGPPVAGDPATTYANVDGLEAALTGLGSQIGNLERFDATVTNAGLSLAAAPLAGLDPDVVSRQLGDALGPDTPVSVQPSTPPEDGAERINAATGRTQFAAGGVWLNRPTFAPTGTACTAAARAVVEAAPIRFVTGSAELDPVSLATINEVAGIVHHCTTEPGARVVIGGHTDAEGDDVANYALSVARARAVHDALRARGIPGARMMPVGYGETEPIADNDTEEGRAKNRRTTFEWPE